MRPQWTYYTISLITFHTVIILYTRMMSEKEFKPTIAFDFDGVIAKYEGFVDPDHVGEPNKKVVGTIRNLKKLGCIIILHSTRGNALLEDYCKKHDIPFDYVNENPELEGANRGKPIATVYVDDRAINYHGQTAEELLDEIKKFRVYWKDAKNPKLHEYWEENGNNHA